MPEISSSLDVTVKKLIVALADLSQQIDTTDLGELAQIHETGTKIDEAIRDKQGAIFDRCRDFCRCVTTTAENIILESCPQPQQSLQNLCRAVRIFHEAVEVNDSLPGVEVVDECLNIIAGKAHNTTDGTRVAAVEPEVKSEPKSIVSEPAATAGVEPSAASVLSTASEEYKSEPLYLSSQETEYVQSFLTECQEHIENIETGLLTLEQTPDDPDKINELFRPFHTIKGMAGFLNLRDVQALTHEMETLLDLGRKGKMKITSATIDLIFDALDVLKVQVSSIGQFLAKPNNEAIPQPPLNDILHRLKLATTGKYLQTAQSAGSESFVGQPLGEILIDKGQVPPDVVDFALQQQKQSSDHKPLGTILTSMGTVNAKDVDKALRQQKTEVQEAVVRVDTIKLDNLVNMVGELVIIQTQVEQNPLVRQTPALARLIEQVSKITRDVQEMAMSMRMVPLTQTFHKMGRVVRDLAKKVGKKINYELDGEDTELDKNVIQELSDPLMHMIRNSVDHGIESPEKRLAAGKPETGTVKLRAYHQGGNIVIEISDDGKGLDRDFLIKKAVEKGLIDGDAQLTEQQAFNLIMAPGFSTAEKITDISGRGVGMDVVKRNIDKLRGKVEIHSVKGEGTTFTIRLPLTLAVIDGMIVRVGTQKFVIPTLSIVQALAPSPDQIQTVQGKGRILNLRGQIYPLISLKAMLKIHKEREEMNQEMVVIAQAEDQQVGLILDELLGQQQVVIKSLGDSFKSVTGITGGAILGDGTIGLILEPAGLLEMSRRNKAE